MSFMGEHFTITATDGGQMKVTGNWAGREFHVQKDGTDVIYASRQFFSLHDAYGIQVAPGFDAPLALAIVVALEQVEKEEGHESSPLGGLLAAEVCWAAEVWAESSASRLKSASQRNTEVPAGIELARRLLTTVAHHHACVTNPDLLAPAVHPEDGRPSTTV